MNFISSILWLFLAVLPASPLYRKKISDEFFKKITFHRSNLWSPQIVFFITFKLSCQNTLVRHGVVRWKREGGMGKYIYIISGIALYSFSFLSHEKWKLMIRNDLVFWPLKYLIFEVCRWLSGADRNSSHSIMIIRRSEGARRAKRTTIKSCRRKTKDGDWLA